MKLYTAKQMNEMDRLAVQSYQIPSILLMEHAALRIYEQLAVHGQDKKIVILCGPGNNGGDGFALARQLFLWASKEVVVVSMVVEEQLRGDGKVYYEICKALGIEMLIGASVATIQNVIEKAQIVVDGLFGTGLTRNIEGAFATIITFLNQANKEVWSIDIPSGIHADTGKILGVAVKATHTVTFQCYKVGQWLYPAIDYIGRIEVVDIGIPSVLVDSLQGKVSGIKEETVMPLLTQRATRSNKGTYGKVLLVGGQQGMSGAICLATEAAMRVGAGTVTAMIPDEVLPIVATKLTECMTLAAPSNAGSFAAGAVTYLQNKLPNYTVVAVGPGMGRTEYTKEMVRVVLASNLPCVIDADGLFYLADLGELLQKREAPTVITPHPGEMARLIGKTIQEVLENPMEIATTFACKYGTYVVLKLERAIVATPDGSVWLYDVGNVGMAKGGSGDVLCGIITGLVAQNEAFGNMIQLGAWLHGAAGDSCKACLGMYAMLPSDLIKEAGKVLKEMAVN